jgi:hypothetical protein
MSIISESEENSFMSMDGYDDCLVGVVEQCGRPPIFCYDRSLVIKKLMENDMSHEECINLASEMS